MVNPNSDLYRQHPDWVFHYPNRTRHETRNQLMLNLAREDVYQYLYSCFSTLLREKQYQVYQMGYEQRGDGTWIPVGSDR